MTQLFSTGYRNAAAAAALGAAAGTPIMSGCTIRVYSGAVPTSADAALGSAVLLAEYSLNGTGAALAWGAAAGGSISKVTGDVWSGVGLSTGTPAFFRYQLPTDDGTESTTAVRIQGSVGVVSDPNADLALSTLAIALGAPLTIDAATATVLASL